MLKIYLIAHFVAIVLAVLLSILRVRILKKKFGIPKKTSLPEEKILVWIKLILIPFLPTIVCICALFVDDSKYTDYLY